MMLEQLNDIALSIVSDVQLIDNTPEEANRVKHELIKLISDTLKCFSSPTASDPAAIEAWLRAELARQPEAERFAWINKVYDAVEMLFGEAMGPAR